MTTLIDIVVGGVGMGSHTFEHHDDSKKLCYMYTQCISKAQSVTVVF